jgi:hypothetical protein
MKKWQLGICVTCAAVLASMFLFGNTAQAAGVVQMAPAQVARCIWPQPAPHHLLADVEAQTRMAAARLVREAVVALRQSVLVIELPGFETPRHSVPVTPALASTLEE